MSRHNGISSPSMRMKSAWMTNEAEVAKNKTGTLHQRSDHATSASPTTRMQALGERHAEDVVPTEQVANGVARAP